MNRCPRCEKTWGGLKAEHCPSCHETFSSTSAGDKHRKGDHDHRHCVPPATVGLEFHSRQNGGVWSAPGPGADRPSNPYPDGTAGH